MNGIEERSTVLNLADSSSQIKRRKPYEEENRNDVMANFSGHSCMAPTAAIIISSHDKHSGELHGTIDSSGAYLTSSSLGEDHGNFQVLGVASGDSGEQILVITPMPNQSPGPAPPNQDTHQPLIVNGLHFQAAQSVGSSSEQQNSSAILAAQFELIKSTCPTLNSHDDRLRDKNIPLRQQHDDEMRTVTFRESSEYCPREMAADEHVVVLYEGRQPSNLDTVIHSVAAETTGNAFDKLPAAIAESIFGPDYQEILKAMNNTTVNEAYRKCVICLQRQPIARDIFDANHILSQNMAVLAAYLYIDPRNEEEDSGICPQCLEQLLNWHAFSTAIRTRHDAVRSWPGITFDNVALNDTAIKSRLYHNPKKTAELKSHYWSQSHQHSFLVRRHLTDSDFDFLGEYLAKYSPPPEKEKSLVKAYLNSLEKLTHIFCVHCRRLIDGGKIGYEEHMNNNHPLEDVKFPCELCGMLNSEYDDAYFSHWISHLYTEKCDKCDDRFPNGRVYRQHLLYKHNQRRPKPKRKPKTKHIECPHCDTCLSTSSSLKKHIDYKHYDGPLQHNCGYCDKQFRWRYLLVRHERNVHRKKKTVLIRPQSFETNRRSTRDDGRRASSSRSKPTTTTAAPRGGGGDKMPKRQNYSPDINPGAHSNGFTRNKGDGQGSAKVENKAAATGKAPEAGPSAACNGSVSAASASSVSTATNSEPPESTINPSVENEKNSTESCPREGGAEKNSPGKVSTYDLLSVSVYQS